MREASNVNQTNRSNSYGWKEHLIPAEGSILATEEYSFAFDTDVDKTITNSWEMKPESFFNTGYEPNKFKARTISCNVLKHHALGLMCLC